jgi:GNAT superfamily N-acetyltransferase
MHKGASSGYEFIFAEQAGEVLGYTCFGLIPCTLASYDLYWIAVDPRRQKCGLGQTLMRQTKETVRRLGGTRIYADTSGRSQYQPTRSFYLKCGFRLDALLKDFYAPADDKCIFVLQL